MKGKKSSLQQQLATAGRATAVVIAAACLAGTALLTWWALRFHASYAQLGGMHPRRRLRRAPLLPRRRRRRALVRRGLMHMMVRLIEEN
jgi:hypothetical protein